MYNFVQQFEEVQDEGISCKEIIFVFALHVVGFLMLRFFLPL
jgi:hypothetical protein